MDDNTEDQLAYEEGVAKLRGAVKDLEKAGKDFSKRAVREEFKNKVISTATRMVNDKRIFK
ncbi:MAG: hypothetical protein GY810_01220 [Aureispira sp.]|nr:hypothetical protein [Aureispira sp.]